MKKRVVVTGMGVAAPNAQVWMIMRRRSEAVFRVSVLFLNYRS